MTNIIKIDKDELLIRIAKNYIEKKEYKKALLILEDIKNKSYSITKILIDLYLFENYQYRDFIKLIKNLFLYKDFSSFEAILILKKLKENKKYALVFSLLKRCLNFFYNDPFFKIEIIRFLVKNSKYNLAYNCLKRYKESIDYENYLFYKGYILKEKNKKLRTLFYFHKLVKNYPFNIVYRYFFACILEEIHFLSISKKQINFIKDFLRFIPRVVNYDYDEINFKNFIFKTIWDELRY